MALLLMACAGPPPVADVVLSAGESVNIPYSAPAGLIVIQGTLGKTGEEWAFLLDTGVNPSVVDLARAQEVGIPLDGRNPMAVGGAGNRALLAYPADVSDLRLGGRRLPPVEAVAMDLSSVANALETPVHGALGHSMLADRVLTIDPASKLITLHQPPWDSSHPSLPLRIREGSPSSDSVYLNGRRLRAAFDTGAQPMLTVATARAVDLGLGAVLNSATAGTVLGARGSAPVLRARADSLRIGDQTLHDVPVTFADWVEGGDAIVGMDFFNHFVTTFDYASSRLFLKRLESSTGPQP